MKSEDPPTPTTEGTVALSNADAPPARTRARLRALFARETALRLLRDRSVRAALFTGTLSRGIALVIFVLVGLMKTTPDVFPGHLDAYISARSAPVAGVLREEVLTADVNW